MAAPGRLHEYKMMPESGHTGDQLAQPQCLARFQSALKSLVHRLPRCRGSERCFPVWNVQVEAELPAGSSSACRSGLPSSFAWNASRRQMNQDRQPRPSDALSAHIGVSRHEVI